MRTRQRERQRNKSENATLFREAEFHAGLTTGIHNDKGFGPSAFTRTSAAWTIDADGKLINVPAGSARFHGARMVANRLSLNAYSEDFTGSGWTKSNVTISGTKTIVSTAGASIQRVYPSTFITVGYAEYYCVSARLTYINHPFIQLALHGGQSLRANFDLVNGTHDFSAGVSGGMSLVSANVWDVYAIIPSLLVQSTSSKPQIVFVNSLGSGITSTFTGDGVLSFGLDRVMLENVTGQTDMRPSEYVKVGYFEPSRNLLTYTNDFTQSVWSKSNITVTHGAIANPINGNVDAIKVEATTTATANFNYIGTGLARAPGIHYVVYIKRGSGDTDGNRFIIRNNTTATNLLGISFNYATGVITYTYGSTGVTAVDVGDSWWKLTMIQPTGFSDGDTFYVYGGFTGSSETAGEYCYLYLPHVGVGDTPPTTTNHVGAAYDPHGSGVENVKWFGSKRDGSGISTLQNAGGLVSENGSRTNNILFSSDLAGPTYFETANSITPKAWIPTTTGSENVTNGTFNSDISGWGNGGTSSNSWSAGAARVDTTSGSGGLYQDVSLTIGKTYFLTGNVTVVSGTSLGIRVYTDNSLTTVLKSQLASSNHTVGIIFTATASSHRIYLVGTTTASVADFDNVSILEATCAPQRTATGLCGCVNSATTLTATANDAVIYQTLVLAAAARSSSAYVRRKTGTGTISFGRWASAGAQSWTDITSLINATTWTRVHIDDSTLLDPAIGFKISTNGDEIEVDVVQDEAGSTSSSPIVTIGATVTRTGESLTYQRFGNYGTTAGAVLATWAYAGQGPTVTGSSSGVVGVGGTNHNFIRCGNTAATNRGNMRDGTTTLTSNAGLERSNYSPRRQASSWGATGQQTITEGSGSVSTAVFDGSMAESDVLQIGGDVFCGTVKDLHSLASRELTSAELLSIGD